MNPSVPPTIPPSQSQHTQKRGERPNIVNLNTHLHGHQATLWAASEEALDAHERKRTLEAMYARRAKQVLHLQPGTLLLLNSFPTPPPQRARSKLRTK